jgi:hypothetical protein
VLLLVKVFLRSQQWSFSVELGTSGLYYLYQVADYLVSRKLGIMECYSHTLTPGQVQGHCQIKKGSCLFHLFIMEEIYTLKLSSHVETFNH